MESMLPDRARNGSRRDEGSCEDRNMDRDPGPALAAAHYDQGGEALRLASGPLEHERTRELLRRYLPEPPVRVADIGAGPGAYSLWLAERGYDVTARDLMPLGPLYHLQERAGRVQVLREASRIVRAGGVVLAVVISRWAVVLDGMLRLRLGETDPGFAALVDTAIGTGRLDPFHRGGFSGYVHRPAELQTEVAEAGLRERALPSIEGPGAYLVDIDERWSTPAARELVLDVAGRLEAVPELAGMGSHLMLVAERPG
jgi:hypothetical protein